MPLPTFDKQEDIPEAVRSGYVEKNGKWVPEIDDSALRSNYQKALDERKRTAAELEQWRSVIGDRKPDEIAALLQAQRDAEEKRMRDAGESEKVIAKRLAERDAEWQKKLDAVAPYKAKFEDSTIESAIRRAALAGGVDPKDLEEYVIPLTKGRRIKMDGDKIVVVDKDGDPTGLTPEKFFAETFKQEAPKFYQAAGGSGGGANGGFGSRSASTGNVASDIQDFVSRITADKNALAAAKTGQLTVRSA